MISMIMQELQNQNKSERQNLKKRKMLILMIFTPLYNVGKVKGYSQLLLCEALKKATFQSVGFPPLLQNCLTSRLHHCPSPLIMNEGCWVSDLHSSAFFQNGQDRGQALRDVEIQVFGDSAARQNEIQPCQDGSIHEVGENVEKKIRKGNFVFAINEIDMILRRSDFLINMR